MTDNSTLYAMYHHVKQIIASEGITGAARYSSGLLDLGEPELATNVLLSISIYCKIHPIATADLPAANAVLDASQYKHAVVSIKQDATDFFPMLENLYVTGDLHKFDLGCNIFEESDKESREMQRDCFKPTFH